MDQATELILCTEAEFDHRIGKLDIKGLMETIISLQKEMSKEQENFDELTQKLSEIPDHSSTEYAMVSNDLMESQSRLALLMGRNMKCFTQQTANQNQELLADLVSQSGKEDGQTTDREFKHHSNNIVQNGSSDSSGEFAVSKTSPRLMNGGSGEPDLGGEVDIASSRHPPSAGGEGDVPRFGHPAFAGGDSRLAEKDIPSKHGAAFSEDHSKETHRDSQTKASNSIPEPPTSKVVSQTTLTFKLSHTQYSKPPKKKKVPTATLR